LQYRQRFAGVNLAIRLAIIGKAVGIYEFDVILTIAEIIEA
jgi:hypothetical protein